MVDILSYTIILIGAMCVTSVCGMVLLRTMQRYQRQKNIKKIKKGLKM